MNSVACERFRWFRCGIEFKVSSLDMASDDSFLNEIPSLEKVPDQYDDRIGEMSEFYQKIAAEELHESETIREQSLNQLRDWIAKHPNIQKCRTDALFLLRFLRSKKYSFNAASECLERFLAARMVHPHWLTNLDIEDPELNALVTAGYLYPLPERDAHGRTITFNETVQFDATKFKASHATRAHQLVFESLYDQQEVQCAGIVHVYDVSGMTMAQLSLISLNEIKTLAEYMAKATPLRIREFHFINTPGATLALVNIVLQFLSEKLRKRVFCHRSWDELYAKVDRKLLPKEHGGQTSKAECIEIFKQRCQRLRPRMLQMNELALDISSRDESKHWRSESSTDAELEAGAIGSFRKLAVD
ncbi:retinaldehyde-binding protein 1-like [Culex pipiens pallens]|uniref:retinaldehyde-binding protein 1-like n=1 Tax=Culex pipiens pallens TaxID=42434 RepID=UPI0019532AB4|nr:retinaldehyde-binding protein 1-like [Culex pipiens pallens]